MSAKEELEKITEKLKQQRDELRVQLDLAQADIKSEWDALEENWAHYSAKLKQVANEAKASGKEVGEAAKLLGEELHKGYERIRRRLS